MGLNREQKKTVVSEVSQTMSVAQAAILAEYRGLTVPAVSAFRTWAREGGGAGPTGPWRSATPVPAGWTPMAHQRSSPPRQMHMHATCARLIGAIGASVLDWRQASFAIGNQCF